MSNEIKPFRFRRSGHIVIRCADAERTAQFFREIVGLKQYGTVARGMHFLASDFADNHHQVLVRPAKDGAPAPAPDSRIGFARIAFEMTTPGEIAALKANLCAHAIALEEAERPGGVAFRDPDGNLFEFYCGAESHARHAHAAARHAAQQGKTEAAL